MSTEFEYSIEERVGEDWMPVVSGTTPDLIEAVRESQHYASQYAQDGDIRVTVFRREVLYQSVTGEA